jgi:hypothetical protein
MVQSGVSAGHADEQTDASRLKFLRAGRVPPYSFADERKPVIGVDEQKGAA